MSKAINSTSRNHNLKLQPKKNGIFLNLLNNIFKAIQFFLNHPAKVITLGLASQIMGARANDLGAVKKNPTEWNSLSHEMHLNVPYLNANLSHLEQKLTPVVLSKWNKNNLETIEEYRNNLAGKKRTKRNMVRTGIANVLYVAASEGNLPVVRYLIQHGADVNSQDENGNTPLHWAAEKGHLSIVRYLVEQRANIDVKGKRGKSPLHLAARKGHLLIVQYLEEQGANIQAQDDGGRTPLHWAAESNNLSIVRYLIEHGATIDAKGNRGRTALHLAAKKGYLPIVQYLTEQGADINALDGNSLFPALLAGADGHMAVVEYLESQQGVHRPRRSVDAQSLNPIQNSNPSNQRKLYWGRFTSVPFKKVLSTKYTDESLTPVTQDLRL